VTQQVIDYRHNGLHVRIAESELALAMFFASFGEFVGNWGLRAETE
jgi:hypothetical protein